MSNQPILQPPTIEGTIWGSRRRHDRDQISIRTIDGLLLWGSLPYNLKGVVKEGDDIRFVAASCGNYDGGEWLWPRHGEVLS